MTRRMMTTGTNTLEEVRLYCSSQVFYSSNHYDFGFCPLLVSRGRQLAPLTGIPSTPMLLSTLVDHPTPTLRLRHLLVSEEDNSFSLTLA